jgi:large subunit ribosomal protein L7/L12
MADIPGPIMALGDQIANLKLSEAALLKMYLKDKYGIEPAAGGAVMMAAGPAAAGPAAAAPVEEKTEFTVVLEGLADASKKIPLIKVVREITGCGLSEGKKLVDEAPKPIKENIPKDEAEAIKKKLEEAGGKVALK